jgi:hypothetical protein
MMIHNDTQFIEENNAASTKIQRNFLKDFMFVIGLRPKKISRDKQRRSRQSWQRNILVYY